MISVGFHPLLLYHNMNRASDYPVHMNRASDFPVHMPSVNRASDFLVHFPVHVTSVSCFQHHKSHDMHCLWEISFPDHILDLLFLQKHGTEKFRVVQILP